MTFALSALLLAVSYGSAWAVATAIESRRTGVLDPVATISDSDGFELTLYASVAMLAILVAALFLVRVV